jgi:hypothetical protein
MKTKQSQQPKPEAKESAAAPAQPKPAASAPKAAKPAKQKKAAKGKPGGAAKPRKREGLSGLDAAAKVLASAKEPLGCGEIVERILEAKLWKTGGKTPAATINAAMLREIKGKGKEARFKKVGRGKFAAVR